MVPGAFHSSSVFEKVIAILRQANYHHVDALDLRSVGHLVGRQRDIQPVVDALHRHINDGRDVVLVGNSMYTVLSVLDFDTCVPKCFQIYEKAMR